MRRRGTDGEGQARGQARSARQSLIVSQALNQGNSAEVSLDADSVGDQEGGVRAIHGAHREVDDRGGGAGARSQMTSDRDPDDLCGPADHYPAPAGLATERHPRREPGLTR
jgi:hypothetical protein